MSSEDYISLNLLCPETLQSFIDIIYTYHTKKMRYMILKVTTFNDIEDKEKMNRRT